MVQTSATSCGSAGNSADIYWCSFTGAPLPEHVIRWVNPRDNASLTMLCFADRTEVIFGLETGAVSIYCHECYERGQGGKRGCKAQTEDGCVQSVMEAAATTAERRQKTGRLPRILIDDRATMPERSFVRKEQVT
jgi:hypothetical protein